MESSDLSGGDEWFGFGQREDAQPGGKPVGEPVQRIVVVAGLLDAADPSCRLYTNGSACRAHVQTGGGDEFGRAMIKCRRDYVLLTRYALGRQSSRSGENIHVYSVRCRRAEPDTTRGDSSSLAESIVM